jgi:ribosomal protein L34E
MYNEKLEKLIEMALMDGELTAQERNVLMKKAEEAGVDADEFEMVLEARLFEKKQSSSNTNSETARPKTDKHGGIIKCPACGAPVQASMAKCPDCGHEFSGIEANSSITKLFEMLNAAEDGRKQESDTNNPLSAMGGMMSDAFNDLRGPGKVDKKKMEIISNFPIPTTKNDILEFLSLSVPKAKKSGNFFTQNQPEHKAHNSFVPVWKGKCEQIIMKAKFSMKDDRKVLDEIMSYANEIGIK